MSNGGGDGNTDHLNGKRPNRCVHVVSAFAEWGRAGCGRTVGSSMAQSRAINAATVGSLCAPHPESTSMLQGGRGSHVTASPPDALAFFVLHWNNTATSLGPVQDLITTLLVAGARASRLIAPRMSAGLGVVRSSRPHTLTSNVFVFFVFCPHYPVCAHPPPYTHKMPRPRASQRVDPKGPAHVCRRQWPGRRQWQ